MELLNVVSVAVIAFALLVTWAGWACILWHLWNVRCNPEESRPPCDHADCIRNRGGRCFDCKKGLPLLGRILGKWPCFEKKGVTR